MCLVMWRVSRMVEARLAGHPGDRLWELLQSPPAVDAPVKLWAAWLERQAQLWAAVGEADPPLAANARWMIDYLGRTVKDLRERFQPNDHWSGASSW